MRPLKYVDGPRPDYIRKLEPNQWINQGIAFRSACCVSLIEGSRMINGILAEQSWNKSFPHPVIAKIIPMIRGQNDHGVVPQAIGFQIVK